MDAAQAESRAQSFGGWPVWAGALVVVYLAIGLTGWQRTLIPDEIWALLHCTQPLSEQLRSVRLDLVHPPLIYLVERVWIDAFGDSDNAVKALALIVNIPTIVLFTYLARRVTVHWRLASVLFGSEFLHVGSVANLVRMYGVALLLTVVALLLWERWRKAPTGGALAAWTSAMLLLAYTHYVGVLILMAFVVVNTLFGPRRKAFTLAAVGVCAALVPWVVWVLPVYWSQGLEQSLAWVEKEPLRAVGKLPFLFLTSVSSGWNPVEAGLPTDVHGSRWLLITSAAVLELVLLLSAMRRLRPLWPPRREAEDGVRWLWTTAICVVVPIVLLYCFSLVVLPAFDARFLAAVLPAFWLLIALLGQYGGRVGSVLLYAAFLPWVLLDTGVTLAEHIGPSVVHESTVRLVRQARDADLILCGTAIGPQVYWELTHRLGSISRVDVLSSDPSPGWQGVLPQDSMENLDLSGVDRVWLYSRDGRRMTSVIGILQARGFGAGEVLQQDAPFLQVFARDETGIPRGNPLHFGVGGE